MEIGTFGFYVLLPDTEEDAQDERVHLITLLPVNYRPSRFSRHLRGYDDQVILDVVEDACHPVGVHPQEYHLLEREVELAEVTIEAPRDSVILTTRLSRRGSDLRA